MKTLRCSDCVEALMEQSTDINCNLINIKKGSLLYPSTTLVYICKQIENTLITYIHIHKTFDQFNMNRFTNDVMEYLIDKNIFLELKEHINDQNFFTNHLNHLLRYIIQLSFHGLRFRMLIIIDSCIKLSFILYVLFSAVKVIFACLALSCVGCGWSENFVCQYIIIFRYKIWLPLISNTIDFWSYLLF